MAEKFTNFCHNPKNASAPDLYKKQRKPIALEYVKKQSIKNEQNLGAKAPEAGDQLKEFLPELIEDK